jgi:hypothetical protein
MVADLGERHGGIMRIKKVIIIPAILALGAAGSIAGGTAMVATAGHVTTVHAQAAGSSGNPNIFYHM